MLGELLKTWRLQQGISIRTVARQIGIRHETLFRLEGGRACDQFTLIKILDWLLHKAKR